MSLQSAIRVGIVSLLGLVGTSAFADVIVNGSFEMPVAPANGFITVYAGSMAIPGWTVGMTSVDVVNAGFYGGASAYDGVQVLDLNGSPGPGEVSQTFATVAGQTYNLFFAYADTPGYGPQAANVTISNSTFAPTLITRAGTSVPGNLMFSTFSSSFVATGSSSTLDFTGLLVGNVNTGILLDAVSVTAAVPEPSAIILLVTAFGAVLMLSYRKQVRS